MYKTDDLLNGSYRYQKNGWIFLHIIGEPYQRGFQHGFHMARELSDVMKMLDFYLYRQTGKPFSFFMEAAKKIFCRTLKKNTPKNCRESETVQRRPGQNFRWKP